MDWSPRKLVEALGAESKDRRPIMRKVASEASLQALVEAAALTDRPFVRMLICDILGSLADPNCVDSLVVHLGDEDLRVRASAADALGKAIGYTKSVIILDDRRRALIGLLQRLFLEDAREVRSTLVQSIALMGDLTVMPLLQRMSQEDDPMISKQAVWGIEYLRQRATVG
jgi:HEAT repeat protein